MFCLLFEQIAFLFHSFFLSVFFFFFWTVSSRLLELNPWLHAPRRFKSDYQIRETFQTNPLRSDTVDWRGKMDLHTRHVGNDAVLKGSFKPYLTTNAAVPPLFQKILKAGGGGKMNANLCAGAIWTRREGVSCCCLLLACCCCCCMRAVWIRLSSFCGIICVVGFTPWKMRSPSLGEMVRHQK